MAASASRQLERLPERIAAAVIEAFSAISNNPKVVGKPLHGEFVGIWSARRGPYRILYEIDEAARTVSILNVGHRAHIYRRRN